MKLIYRIIKVIVLFSLKYLKIYIDCDGDNKLTSKELQNFLNKLKRKKK